MKFLIIGDVVGEPGRNILFKYLEKRKQNYDFIIVNAENSAGGFGITPKIAEQIFARGADVITLGNHTWDKKEIYSYINEAKNLIRPINFTKEAPGKGYTIVERPSDLLTKFSKITGSSNKEERLVFIVSDIAFRTLRLGLPTPLSNWLSKAVLIPDSSENSLIVILLLFLYSTSLLLS